MNLTQEQSRQLVLDLFYGMDNHGRHPDLGSHLIDGGDLTKEMEEYLDNIWDFDIFAVLLKYGLLEDDRDD